MAFDLDALLNKDFTKSGNYRSEETGFLAFCEQAELPVEADSFLRYLYASLTEEKVKLSTFKKRYYGIKKYLQGRGITLTEHHKEVAAAIQKSFYEAEHIKQTKTEGKMPVDTEELLQAIRQVEDVRARAILMLQFYTANRPSEMVLLKFEHLLVDKKEIKVYLQKQKRFKQKFLPEECVEALKLYQRTYELLDDHYIIGAVNRYGTYTSREVSLYAYYKMLQRWSDLSAYNFRKTMVRYLHDNGAPIEVIQQQTGHANIETLLRHYLKLDVQGVAKYIK